MRRLQGVLLIPLLALALTQTASQGLAVSASPNVRVTNDFVKGSYISADVMGGTGHYTDTTLTRCGTDRRMQNEPTIAIDPRNPAVRTSGSNDYCTVPTNHDAWAGFYRSTNSGQSWVDSLLPGYYLDTSPQARTSPVHQMALAGAHAAGDPVQAWDLNGNAFYMGNNFNRGIPDGNSGTTRDDTGDVWVATYSAATANTSTDGSRYKRTVILAANTFGNGSFNDKTGINVDQTTSSTSGNVYAAWSDFHGAGCNQILLSRSTDHGATFSVPLKISSSLCGNQGPNIAIGPQGQVYVSWAANTGGTRGVGGNFKEGAAFVSSVDGGQTFSKARIAVQFNPFTSTLFSGSTARDCGDGPFACPSGYTFPRFDLAQPTLTTNGGDVDMAFQALSGGNHGQIQFTRSSNGGSTWTAAAPVDSQAAGHQFFPWITAANGRLSAVYYDSRADGDTVGDRPPCNSSSGVGSVCLAVRYSSSTDGGDTWTVHTAVTDALTNPNLEQFGTRRVPFFGDYIMVAAAGNSIAAVWTDQRDAVVAADTSTTADHDGDDVAGDPEAGGTCTSAFKDCFDKTGGLDQNIYSANITP